jgi:hypothetical protein
MAKISKRAWLTFSGKSMVETPALWRMARQFPDVSFDIRQASVTAEIGIMAVLFEGDERDVAGAVAFLREQGVAIDPIEGSVVEG